MVLENSLQVPPSLNLVLLEDSQIPFLGIYLGEIKMVVHTIMFVADIHSSINHDSQTAEITQISIPSWIN